MFLMHANSTPSGRYSTPRRLQPIDPGAFYAVDSWALARSDSFSAHSCVLSRRGAEGKKPGPGPQRNRLRNRYGPRSTNEEAYNNLQPTYTYPQPLVLKAALDPGSIFDRQGGSKFNRRRQPAPRSRSTRTTITAGGPTARPTAYRISTTADSTTRPRRSGCAMASGNCATTGTSAANASHWALVNTLRCGPWG